MPVAMVMALEKAVALAKGGSFVRNCKSSKFDDHGDVTVRKTNNAQVKQYAVEGTTR